jgi:hypothetical protein
VSERTGITLILGRDVMGPNATEVDFDSWVAYVCDRIDAACGFVVEVSERAARASLQANEVRGATEDEQATIEDAKQDLWDDWCAGKRQPAEASAREWLM